jgi:hypothetical protein
MDRRKALKKTGLMTGAALAMPSVFALLQSCKTEDRLTWSPLFFTEKEVLTIAALIDLILPRTDTPGALDVKVDIFLDKFVAKAYDSEGQEQIRGQIADFNVRCQAEFGVPFYDMGNDDRTDFLRLEEKTSGKYNPGIWGTTIGEQVPIGFYRSLKSMILWAYLTSEEIGKNVLNYDPIPGPFLPCIPVAEVGNKWTFG